MLRTGLGDLDRTAIRQWCKLMVGWRVQGPWEGTWEGVCPFELERPVSDATWEHRPTVVWSFNISRELGSQDLHVDFSTLKTFCRPGSVCWPCLPSACHFATPGACFMHWHTDLPAQCFRIISALDDGGREAWCPHKGLLLGMGGTSWFQVLTESVPCSLQAGAALLTSSLRVVCPSAFQSTQTAFFLLASFLVCVGCEGRSSCIFGSLRDTDGRESLKTAGRAVFSLLSLVPKEADFILSNEKARAAAARTFPLSLLLYKTITRPSLKIYIFIVSFLLIHEAFSDYVWGVHTEF